jgi:hypothetical protein
VSQLAGTDPKNKITKCEKFLPQKKSRSANHNSPQIHHDFTIKTPPRTGGFPQTPIKKRP